MKMKMAITGKGGVGKTTFAAIISRLYAEEGYNVLAVDADADPNLALALGFPQEVIDSIIPIAEMKTLVADRTNSNQESFGKMFKINPKVDDIPERYCKEFNKVRLLTMETVESGGSGCICPENVLLKRLTSHLVLQNKDIVVMDMEAGIEHMGRGTAQGVDVFIVVGNKIQSDEDEEYILANIDNEVCLGFMRFRSEVGNADRVNLSPYTSSLETVEEIKSIKIKLENYLLQ